MRQVVARLALALLLTLSVAFPAQADRGVGMWGKDLILLSGTEIPTGSGGTYALCHLVETMTIAFIPVHTTIKSYALSDADCVGTAYRSLSAEDVAQGQAVGALPTDLPVTPQLTPQALVFGHAGPIVLTGALLFLVLTLLIHKRLKRGRRRRISDTLAINALAAMTHVAISDGDVDDREVSHIAGILGRLTGRDYDLGRVRDMIGQVQSHIGDIDALGEGLTEDECRIVLESALHVAVADGQIHPSEYRQVSHIAHRLHIGGADFRDALARIAATMKPGAETA
ncbi:TerB family tellurite resistance protein [Salibaculum sp.]|uniref:tellurite resistance TerB family protein n=1 Tax=Salibaculum sp. TaxID=2855480 RepID=UPI002B460981|nr:TerB family tellurite resistance protein [Salibaculum sp.]HKL69149.1 TerB family tellurite resistance protein [Salibaculum sp.]